MIKKILLSFAFIALTGCQSTLMEPAKQQTLTNSKNGNAQIVFMRSAFVGQAIQASVFDVTGGSPKFIGIVSNDTKINYETTPGEHMFMVVGESADFLKAELSADQTYYTVVSPRMGFWKARFSMHPVRNTDDAKFKYDSKKFKSMDKDSAFVVKGAKATKWAEKNAPDISEKLAEYLPVWKDKGTDKQAEATINAEDHI